MWEYPDSIAEDGYRSSLIRIFDGGTPREGLSMDASSVKPLAGTTGERTTYEWVDATAKPCVVYYYY